MVARELEELAAKPKAAEKSTLFRRLLDKEKQRLAIQDINARVKESLDRFSVSLQLPIQVVTVSLIRFILSELTGAIVSELLAGQTLTAVYGVVESQAELTE